MALGKTIVQFELTKGRYSAQEASIYAIKNDEQDMAIKLVDLLDDKERRDATGEYGRRSIEVALAWEREAPKLLRAYQVLFTL